jgi:N-acetylglucosaminyldiphosphoundecaprenol N-acetyl-beta-D-mannosaminyltransferase
MRSFAEVCAGPHRVQGTKEVTMTVEQIRPDVVIGNVGFRPATERQVVDEVVRACSRGEGGWMITANVDILRKLQQPGVRSLADEASFVLADGMPVLWASRLRGQRLPERVAGSSLIWSLAEAAAEHGLSIYLLGGAQGVAARAGAVLADCYPTLRIAGCYSPPIGFEATPEGRAEIAERVQCAGPDLIFCGFGFPKQERVIATLRPVLPAAWYVGCGAAIPFVAGTLRRAPRWMQVSGLEWVHRLALEPRRLFRRYVVDDIPFAVALLLRAGREGIRSWGRRRV